MLNKKTFFFIAITWTAIITYLSLASLGTIGNTIKIPYKDKMVHFVFYFLFVIFWNLSQNNKLIHKKTTIIILLIAIFYGIIMEFFQYNFTISRHADVYDVLANSFGAIMGLIILMVFKNKKTN
ncbi:VanZ family protein [Flavobacterium sp.]|uniref:VanZ family protein n=1 Tax=Flavobacterium sp. TaxID=239 RepID=UPI00374FE332